MAALPDTDDLAKEEERREKENLAASKIQRAVRTHQGATKATQPAIEEAEVPVAMTEEEVRESFVESCRRLLSDRENYIQQNYALQRQLAKIFSERRSGAAPESSESGQMQSADAESKYWEAIKKLRDDRVNIERKKEESDGDVNIAKEKNQSLLQEAALAEDAFRSYVEEKARAAVFPRTGKPIPTSRIAKFLMEEEELFNQVHDIRVQYIRLRNKNKKLASQLQEKEKLNDGLHLIDFEQLKIENTNLNEKIEERNEDLLKLRKKATTTIHVLTHVKEKLEFVKAENLQLSKQVEEQNEQLTVLRDRLAHAKKEKESFVNENVRMREKMPMIGAEDLLMDYEVRKKEIENLRVQVVTLTNEHHRLMEWITSHQPKLEAMQRSVV